MKQIAQMSNNDALLMISYWRRVPAIDHSRVEATSRVDLGGLVGHRVGTILSLGSRRIDQNMNAAFKNQGISKRDRVGMFAICAIQRIGLSPTHR